MLISQAGMQELDYICFEFNERKSSLIKKIEYYPKRTRGNLFIKFKTNGSEYTYFDVPFHVFTELAASDSVGSYFSKNIKGIYEYEEHEDE